MEPVKYFLWRLVQSQYAHIACRSDWKRNVIYFLFILHVKPCRRRSCSISNSLYEIRIELCLSHYLRKQVYRVESSKHLANVRKLSSYIYYRHKLSYRSVIDSSYLLCIPLMRLYVQHQDIVEVMFFP